MKITLESTTTIVTANGQEMRQWEGTSEDGVPVIAFIARVAVPHGHPTERFERELVEKTLRKAAYPDAFDARMF